MAHPWGLWHPESNAPPSPRGFVSASLVIKNGRVHAVGPRPVQHRRVAVIATSLALAGLAAAFLSPGAQATPDAPPVTAPAPVAQALPAADLGWSDGWGVDWAAFERACRQRGFTPAQTHLAAVVSDRLRGALVMGPGARDDASVAAGLALREQLGKELVQAMASPATLLAFAETLTARVHEEEARLGAHASFDAVGFLATVGWTEDDEHHARGLLAEAKAPAADGMAWEDLRAVWRDQAAALAVPGKGASSLSWAQARVRLERAVADTGLGQLRVSAAVLSSPERADALATRLVGLQAEMSDRLGVTGPVLGLGGRVKLDLSQPLDLDTHGQVVPGPSGVAMRTTLHALPHEHFHAMSALLTQEAPAGARTMAALAAALGEHPGAATAPALAQEARERLAEHLGHLGLSAAMQSELGAAQDRDGEWERLYGDLTQREGLYDQDARMVLLMAMALSPDREAHGHGAPRWSALRQAVGDYLQKSPDLESSLLGQYTGSQEEILASAYAAQFPAEWTQVPGLRLGILDAPGPRDAELQTAAWQGFAQHAQAVWQAPAPHAWRAARAERPEPASVGLGTGGRPGR